MNKQQLEELRLKALELNTLNNTPQDILNFIEHFNTDEMNVATNGYCYHVAIILQSLFGGEIYYNNVVSHFACKINGLYYDKNGISDMEFEPLNKIASNDPLLYSRILRDCVYKLT